MRLVIEFAVKASSDKQLKERCSRESWGTWQSISKKHKELDPQNPAHQNILRFALLDFIADFADWDNSTEADYLNTARSLTQSAHESLGGEIGTRPVVADPFAGGGSIPLEALRIGAEAFASDLNPVAVLLNKVMLEYVPQFGRDLIDEVSTRSAWVMLQAKERLSEFYPCNPSGHAPNAFLWARTILSDAPSPGMPPVEVPLLRSLALAKRQNRNITLGWVYDDDGCVTTETCQVTYADGETKVVRRPLLKISETRSELPSIKGTSRGGAATCPVTGHTTSVEAVREQLIPRCGGTSDSRLMCVVSSDSGAAHKSYQLSTAADLAAVAAATLALKKRRASDPGPFEVDGQINHLRGFFNVVLYGMTRWSHLFSDRQTLALMVFVDLIREVGEKVSKEKGPELAAAVQTCLAMILGRLVDYGSNLCMWASAGEFVCHTFGRQALPMVWDYAEVNPLCETGWGGASAWVLRVLQNIADADLHAGTVRMCSALTQALPDDSVDALATDPPYYAAIPYADLSDFFYIWLKRALHEIQPTLFRSPLAPKDEECVSLSHRAAMYRHKDSAWFEQRMTEACADSRRVTKPSGVSLFVFANKETSGWEAMLAALINSGWVVTASWPIDTERGGRLRARNSAALASSVHLICRPRESSDGFLYGAEVGEWRDVLASLPNRIHDWMPRLQAEGVVGADAIFACLGPALEIFSRHSRVEKPNGEPVTLGEYLEYVWAAVSKEAISMIFEGADTSGFEADARLTAMWLWTLSPGPSNGDSIILDEGEDADKDPDEKQSQPGKLAGFTLEYDAARKIAQGLGAHLELLVNLVEVNGETARLLPVAERTKALFGKEGTESPSSKRKKSAQLSLPGLLEELEQEGSGWTLQNAAKPGTTTLDRLHQAMILFAAGRGEGLRRFLVDDGVGKDQRFWGLAQSLCALYPSGTDERRWSEGVLARKKGLGL